MNTLLETICIRILRRCNLSCTHCWASSTPSASDILDIEKVIKFVDNISILGLKHVSLSGGEPLLYKEFQELIDKLLARDLYLTITTNGSYSNDTNSKLSKVIACNKSRRLRFRVSIDGPKNLHETIRGKQTFDKSITSIKKIKSEMGWVGVNTVTVCDSKENASDLCRALSKLNIDHWGVMTLLPKGSNKNNQDELITIKKKIIYLKDEARKWGLLDKMNIWDYWDRDRGHLIVDANGEVLIPGRNEKRDIIIGRYDEELKIPITNAIIKDLKDNPIAFYKWLPW